MRRLYYVQTIMKHANSPFLLFWRRGLWAALSVTLWLFMLGSIAYIYIESGLPDVDTLKTVQLQVPLRIYSSDSKLIAEYGEKRRIPARYDQIPKLLIDAVLATEDQRYFEHPGVDIFGLMRAGVHLIRTGTKAQGGSTITMQVARNFFLSRKKSYWRKLKEIMLAIKIDRELSKEKILELYLNKIFLGNRAYGVAAAAQVYYGKALADLNLPQIAMIAGLPKAPSALNPLANKVAALKRRDHVLERMLEEKYIDQATYQQAIGTPLSGSYHGRKIVLHAPYIAEVVRQTLFEKFGTATYTDGYQVYTTINSRMQDAANLSVRDNIIAYDKRHGYRGAERNLGTPDVTQLDAWAKKIADQPMVNHLQAAIVIDVGMHQVSALLKSGKLIDIPWAGLSWARRQLPRSSLGPKPQRASDIVRNGDLIRVLQTADQHWQLSQFPEIEGALVSMDPSDGAIRALVGGFNFYQSNYNRALQAERQPGSAFKPFIYAAALAKGYTLASVINDAPVVLNDPSQESLWRPQNDSREFYGPTRLRIGLIRSRNLVSIRLLEAIGIPYALQYVSHFGFNPSKLPKTLSLALGSLTATPLQIATGYAVFANGGYKVDPYIIAHINNAKGEVSYRAQPKIACQQCTTSQAQDGLPEAQQASQVISPQVAYLMTLALRDVIQHGTGRKAKVLNRSDLAGKTGTTNNKVDAWFVGFTKHIITAVWMGFDQPKSIYEYGAQAALPMWIEYMRIALARQPQMLLAEPDGLVSVRIDPKTGLLANANQTDSVFETFRQANVPHQTAPSITVHPDQMLDQHDPNDHIF